MEMMFLSDDSEKLMLILNSDCLENEDGEQYMGYGFTAFRTDPLREIFSVRDLSVNKNEIQELIRLILDNDVSPAHFQDLIDDFLV